MSEPMSAELSIIPRRNFRAYRRLRNNAPWLIIEHEYYEIDEALDTIWRGIDGKQDIAAISRHFSRLLGIPQDEAIEQVHVGLTQMRELHLIEW